MICHSSVVAKGDVFLLPVFGERVGGLFVQLTLFDGYGAARAQRPGSVGAAAAAAVAIGFTTPSTPASSQGITLNILLLFARSE